MRVWQYLTDLIAVLVVIEGCLATGENASCTATNVYRVKISLLGIGVDLIDLIAGVIVVVVCVWIDGVGLASDGDRRLVDINEFSRSIVDVISEDQGVGSQRFAGLALGDGDRFAAAGWDIAGLPATRLGDRVSFLIDGYFGLPMAYSVSV